VTARVRYVHSRRWWDWITRSPAKAPKKHTETDRTARWSLAWLAHWAEHETPCGPCSLARRFGAVVPVLAEPCEWRP
jgi:hypothetical protein